MEEPTGILWPQALSNRLEAQRGAGYAGGSHSMSWQNWEQTRCPKLVLILYLCLLLLSTSFNDIYFLIFTKIINDDYRNFRKQTKEETKSHSEIIINFFCSVFGFMTCFWPMHKNFYQKYDHATVLYKFSTLTIYMVILFLCQ